WRILHRLDGRRRASSLMALFRREPGMRERINPVAPDQKRLKTLRKQRRKRHTEHVETAGIGSERRQHAARAVADEAAPPQMPRPRHRDRHRMQMSRELAANAAYARLMTKHQGSNLDLGRGLAAQHQG